MLRGKLELGLEWGEVSFDEVVCKERLRAISGDLGWNSLRASLDSDER